MYVSLYSHHIPMISPSNFHLPGCKLELPHGKSPSSPGKKKMPCDEFPAAAHLVCDEDQQLTAAALEAARIAVNKCLGGRHSGHPWVPGALLADEITWDWLAASEN